MLTETYRCDRCGVQVHPGHVIRYRQIHGDPRLPTIDFCPRCELQFRGWFHDDAPDYSDGLMVAEEEDSGW